jgi:hypothetical protein
MIKKKKVGIVLFIIIVICIIFVDIFALKGVLIRDFMTNFIHSGMTGEQVGTYLGMPQQSVGSGVPVMEYDLPFQAHFYVTYDGNANVINTSVSDNIYPLRGWLLPIIMLCIALLEKLIYNYWQSKKQ